MSRSQRTGSVGHPLAIQGAAGGWMDRHRTRVRLCDLPAKSIRRDHDHETLRHQRHHPRSRRFHPLVRLHHAALRLLVTRGNEGAPGRLLGSSTAARLGHHRLRPGEVQGTRPVPVHCSQRPLRGHEEGHGHALCREDHDLAQGPAVADAPPQHQGRGHHQPRRRQAGARTVHARSRRRHRPQGRGRRCRSTALSTGCRRAGS